MMIPANKFVTNISGFNSITVNLKICCTTKALFWSIVQMIDEGIILSKMHNTMTIPFFT